MNHQLTEGAIKYMDVWKYNLVNDTISQNPGYLLPNEMHFDIYVGPDQELCIVGRVDHNYICWASITHCTETDLSVSIINHLLNLNPTMFSTTGYALSSHYEKVMTWHRFSILKKERDGQSKYFSQGTHLYFDTNHRYLAKWLANEISCFYTQESLKCQFRLVDKTYVTILKGYEKLLKREKSVEHYFDTKPLRSILEAESYLRLAKDQDVRSTYLSCMKECQSLYNLYMSKVR